MSILRGWLWVLSRTSPASRGPRASRSRRSSAPTRSSRRCAPWCRSTTPRSPPSTPSTGRAGCSRTWATRTTCSSTSTAREFDEEIRSLDMHETGYPVRMRDVPGDALAVRTIAEKLVPAGYTEGMTMCLRTASGRETGLLNLSTSDARHPSDYGARHRVGALRDARQRGRRDPVGAVPGVAARARRVRDRPVPRGRRHAAGRHRDAPAAERRRPAAPPRARHHRARRPRQHPVPVARRRSPLAPGRRHAVPVRRPRRLRGHRHRPGRDDRHRAHPPRARGADDAHVRLVERRDRLAAVDLAAHRRHLRRGRPREARACRPGPRPPPGPSPRA